MICDLSGIDTKNSKLSIRVLPDGLCFFISTPDSTTQQAVQYSADGSDAPVRVVPEQLRAEFAEVTVLNLSHKTVSVPGELAREDIYAQYFMLNGTPLADNETIIASHCGQMTQLFSMDSALAAVVHEAFPNAVYTNPIAENIAMYRPSENVVVLYTSSSHLFITTQYGGALLCSDVLPCCDFASLLLLVNRTIVNNKVGKVKIVCRGESSQKYAENLRRYYIDVEVK